MSVLNKLIKVFNIGLGKKLRIQDYIVIISLLLFSAVLIIGLLPERSANTEEYRILFMNAVMGIPVLIAVYFIIISFRKKVSSDYLNVGTSIRTKISLAFLFVAVIPSMPIIIISNSLINKTIAEIISPETQSAIDNGIKMSENEILDYKEKILSELKTISLAANSNIVDLYNLDDRNFLSASARYKKMYFQIYFVDSTGIFNSLIRLDGESYDMPYSDGINDYLKVANIRHGISVSRIGVDEMNVMVGMNYSYPFVSVLYMEIPKKYFEMAEAFTRAKMDYNEKTTYVPYVQTAMGIILLSLSVGIIVISVIFSIILSKSITKPALELVDAAESVAKGNFGIKLYRSTSDEIALLYQSFNSMVRQLEESRKAMLHLQKLEAWTEVGRKLLHEIKNPLTPIRLSAERIRRKFIDKKDDLEGALMTGTETIIEEVNALQHILNEFSTFARLPKAKLERNNFNETISYCVRAYEGKESIKFTLDLDDNIQDILFDKLLIRQALINIIKNAIEAMNGAGEIKITSVLKNNSTVVLSIKDNGPGILPDDIEKIFEPTFSKKDTGTGLGLAIVEKIVIEHGGYIKCESVPGNGADFIIILPAKKRMQEIING